MLIIPVLLCLSQVFVLFLFALVKKILVIVLMIRSSLPIQGNYMLYH